MRSRIFLTGFLALFLFVMVGAAYSKNLPSITMLSTKTCPACNQMEKTLKELRTKFPGKVSTVHVFLEDNPDIAKKYNVRYVPTLIFKNSDGKDVAQVIGYRTLDDVLKTFSDFGIKID